MWMYNCVGHRIVYLILVRHGNIETESSARRNATRPQIHI